VIDPEPQFAYTPAQAAKLLGLTEPAIRTRIFRGQLPVQRWGRRLLIRHVDLMAVLERKEAE
jgi:excisionase family DNA binding protein